ncbi:restriction endonuclease subunit S [Pokkaliibacter sp. MBI-7]|uniref:restriction endonuclease subunit S n=1 Tax=Pokkaliibacter sp. MBI-7 TaxID=3040600 RepID=UPI0024489E05|nr:restriction endonuclease subunit S [Pokkaliibacter sp. MBI-7]MDH2431836.1 restriction endonuclease subunit S [Pokkaliibacter sp. MBI-7]
MSEFNLPLGWTETTLGNTLISVIGGGTPSRKVPAYFDGHIPWFTVKDMKALRPNDAEEHISEEAIADSATNLIPANTLIVATRIALGRAIRPTVACAINQDLKALVLGNGISSDFLLYWVGANQRVIQDLGSGTTVSGIRLEALHGLPLHLPPAAEQTRIVAKLEELLSDLDAGVAELKAAQQKLGQYRQSLLKAAVEGALTAEWRANNSPKETGAQLLERILTERRARWEAKQLAKFKEQSKKPPKDWQKKYPEPVQPDTSDLPELPEGWVWASLDQLVAESSYGTSVKCSYESNGIPVLRIPNVSGGSLDLRDMKFSNVDLSLDKDAPLAIGDVLVIRTNGSIGLVGRAAAVVTDLPAPHYFASYLLRLRCVETTCVHRWILAVLTAHTGRRWLEARAASSAGQHNISLSTLLTMPIPLPPTTEQSIVLAEFEAGNEVIKRQDEATNLSLEQSSAQRQNILRAAFASELVPQDPNDEPASVLLERIRAERAAKESVKKTRGRKTKRSIRSE